MISTSKKPVSDDLNNIQSYKSLLLSSLRSSTFLNPTLNLHSPSSTLYVSPSLTSLATCAVIGVSCSTSSVGSYAGFTGLGMLRASTFGQSDSGNIDADQVERAIKLGCAGREECLVIVDGGCTDEDLLRIAIGMERVRDELGLRIDWVLPCRILEGPAAAAANLLCKIIGAAAERGLPLSILAPLGKVVSNSLDVITHFGPPISDVANPTEDNSSLATTSSISTLVSSLLSSLLTSQSRNPIPFLQNVDGVEEKETALVITHFGGISSLEVGSIVDHVVRQLSEHDIHPSRLYSIPSSASESRGGFSIALLNISHAHYLFRAALLQASQSQSSSALPTGHGEDDDEYAFEEWLESLHVPDILTLLDDPTGTQCWSSNGTSPYSTSHSNPSANSGSASSAIRNVGWTWPRNPKRAKGEKENDEEFSAKVIFGASMASSRRNTGVGVHSSEIEAVRGACIRVIGDEASREPEPDRTEYRFGPCAEVILSSLPLPPNKIGSSLKTKLNGSGEAGTENVDLSGRKAMMNSLARIFEKRVPGRNGALLSMYLTMLSSSLKKDESANGIAFDIWSDAAKNAFDALSEVRTDDSLSVLGVNNESVHAREDEQGDSDEGVMLILDGFLQSFSPSESTKAKAKNPGEEWEKSLREAVLEAQTRAQDRELLQKDRIDAQSGIRGMLSILEGLAEGIFGNTTS